MFRNVEVDGLNIWLFAEVAYCEEIFMSGSNLTDSQFIGERLTADGFAADTIWEHVYRYRFATAFAPGQEILDVACGEGYGAAALAESGAKRVIGVDIDEATVARAVGKYVRPNLAYRVGDALAIPLARGTIDLVVSFETIEHVSDPGGFLNECCRVLRTPGRLVISTPNQIASPGGNPYHIKEFLEGEFVALLQQRFRQVSVYWQRLQHGSRWSLRSLASDPGPWSGWPGNGVLRRVSRVFRLAPEIRARASLVQAILEPEEGWFGRLFNPYCVRTPILPGSYVPTYFVCVAEV